jgi:hypothetical protein
MCSSGFRSAWSNSVTENYREFFRQDFTLMRYSRGFCYGLIMLHRSVLSSLPYRRVPIFNEPDNPQVQGKTRETG